MSSLRQPWVTSVDLNFCVYKGVSVSKGKELQLTAFLPWHTSGDQDTSSQCCCHMCVRPTQVGWYEPVFQPSLPFAAISLTMEAQIFGAGSSVMKIKLHGPLLCQQQGVNIAVAQVNEGKEEYISPTCYLLSKVRHRPVKTLVSPT